MRILSAIALLTVTTCFCQGQFGNSSGISVSGDAQVNVDTQKQLLQFGIISLGLKILLAFIGTITLGIGGVGLMNIMLVSVAQRTREIGVEKALGARKRDILFQFLAEALVITAVGGVFGILLSYAVSLSVGRLSTTILALGAW